MSREDRTLRGAAAIVGVTDDVSPTGELDRSGRALEVAMILDALEDAGLTLADVDGVCHAESAVGLAEYLGIHPTFTESTMTGGSSYEVHLAPISAPPKLICIGLNYRDHAIESNMELPKTPVVFTKFSNSIIGPGDTVVLPKASTQPDYEAELAIVIGKAGRNIAAADWQQHVFGYTIINDVSARDIQLATSQWSLGKSFDTFCPMGPAIVSLDEIGDPHNLAIKLSINGEYLQNSNTDELIFKTGDLIAYLSSIMTLTPGDIISTGTPAGVGLGRNPKRWIQPNETMTVEIQNIGSLTNPTQAE